MLNKSFHSHHSYFYHGQSLAGLSPESLGGISSTNCAYRKNYVPMQKRDEHWWTRYRTYQGKTKKHEYIIWPFLPDLIGGWAATLKKICSSIGIIIAVYRSSISWNWNLLETIHQLFLENWSFYFSNQNPSSSQKNYTAPTWAAAIIFFRSFERFWEVLLAWMREILWNLGGFSEEFPKKNLNDDGPRSSITMFACYIEGNPWYMNSSYCKPWAIFANIRVGLLGSKTSIWSGASWLLHVA